MGRNQPFTLLDLLQWGETCDDFFFTLGEQCMTAVEEGQTARRGDRRYTVYTAQCITSGEAPLGLARP